MKENLFPQLVRPIKEAFKFNSKDFPFSSNLINFSVYPPTPKSLSLSLSLTHSLTHTHTHTHNSLLVFSLFLGFHVTYTLPIIKLRENRGILGQEEQNFPISFS
jgi:hypothetical protein